MHSSIGVVGIFPSGQASLILLRGAVSGAEKQLFANGQRQTEQLLSAVSLVGIIY